jgi:hypothetical protein
MMHNLRTPLTTLNVATSMLVAELEERDVHAHRDAGNVHQRQEPDDGIKTSSSIPALISDRLEPEPDGLPVRTSQNQVTSEVLAILREAMGQLKVV